MNSTEDQEMEHARVGYQVDASLWMYEGQITWAGFNAMLVANSIILAAEGFFAKGLIAIALPILGIILCITWYALTTRGFEVHDYRVQSTREIEERHLSSVLQTVSRGAAFHAGDEVTLTVGGKVKKIRLSLPARLLRTKLLAIIVIGAFGILHFLCLFCCR